MRRVTCLAACAVLAAALAGCGSSATVRHPSAAGGGHGDNDPSFYYPARARVMIRDDGLHPRRLDVGVNTSVLWVNHGSRPHALTWVLGASPHFTSGALAPGQTFLIRFPHVTRVTYRSTGGGHAGFRGVIDVG